MTWHGGYSILEIIRSQHIQNFINNKHNLELSKEMKLANLRAQVFCVWYSSPCPQASRYAQYNLMNLLGRPQIDYLTGAQGRKCQRQANSSTVLS